MIDFFQKDATMTKRIAGTARLADAPTIRARPKWTIRGVGTFRNGSECLARILLEIAETAEARRQGLMGREQIPGVCGMLFDGLSNGGYFWMKDCLAPIDVAFLNKDGTVTKTYQMAVDQEGRRRYPYDAEDVSAVEAAGGFLSRHRIEVGCAFSVERLNKEARHG